MSKEKYNPTVGEIKDSVTLLADLFELNTTEIVMILELGFARWSRVNNFGHLQNSKAEEVFLILRNYVK